jgi:hypothetical protein
LKIKGVSPAQAFAASGQNIYPIAPPRLSRDARHA